MQAPKSNCSDKNARNTIVAMTQAVAIQSKRRCVVLVFLAPEPAIEMTAMTTRPSEDRT